MHLLKTTLLITAAIALVACSSKTKKAQTIAPTKTATPTATTTDTSTSTTNLDTNETTPADTTAGADLGQVIYFEFDSSTLADEARSTLDNNATWLKENKARVLLIEGHTDETGTSEYNLGLGQRRASSARKYLLSMGVAEDRIKVITFGEEKPAGTVDAKNRRSVFIATKKNK